MSFAFCMHVPSDTNSVGVAENLKGPKILFNAIIDIFGLGKKSRCYTCTGHTSFGELKLIGEILSEEGRELCMHACVRACVYVLVTLCVRVCVHCVVFLVSLMIFWCVLSRSVLCGKIVPFCTTVCACAHGSQ